MHRLILLWVQLCKWLSNRGIPLLWVSDPVTKKPSVSLTFVTVSFILCCVSVIAKWSNVSWLGGINFSDGYELFIASAGLYFGRKLSSGPGGSKLEDSTNPPPSV